MTAKELIEQLEDEVKARPDEEVRLLTYDPRRDAEIVHTIRGMRVDTITEGDYIKPERRIYLMGSEEN